MVIISPLLFGRCSDTSAQDTEDYNNFALLAILSQPGPKIRMRNLSGSTENYAIMPKLNSSACSGISAIMEFPENPVSDGTTTDYIQLTSGGDFSIRYATGSCVIGPYSFQVNASYTCASGVSTITCNQD